MPRQPRRVESGLIYHALNRGNGRQPLFLKDGDFRAFLTLLGEATQKFPVDLLAYCLMGNHWHLLVRPRADDVLSPMMGWLTVTHARRYHQHYPDPGTGHVYQGRYKSFPVQSDEHFLTVARYIHANPLRAGLVDRAEKWAWSDLASSASSLLATHEWPVDRPRHWLRLVNQTMDEREMAAVRTSVERGTPFGSAAWVRRAAKNLGLESTTRPRGRPTKPMAELNPRYRRQIERADKSG